MKNIFLVTLLILVSCATTSQSGGGDTATAPYCSVFDDVDHQEIARATLGSYADLVWSDVNVVYCSPVVNNESGYLIFSSKLQDKNMSKPYFRIDKSLLFKLEQGQWNIVSEDIIFFILDKRMISPQLRDAMTIQQNPIEEL